MSPMPIVDYLSSHYDTRDRYVEIIDSHTAIVWNSSSQRDRLSGSGVKQTTERKQPRFTPERKQLRLNQLTGDQRNRLFGKE